MEVTGTTHIDGVDAALAERLDAVISMAYMEGIYLQSNYARSCPEVLAAAASLGLITTETADGCFGRVWRPSYSGLLWVQSGRINV